MACDVVLNGITGAVGLRPTLRRARRGQHPRPGQQGVAHHRRAGGHRAGRTRARSCRSTPSTAPWPSACAAGSADEVRRLVLTACGGPFRGRRPEDLHDVTPEQALAAPDLVDGPGGHDQLRHPGQQGPRGDRGAPALRDPLRPDRGRRAPHLGGPLDGGVPRRVDVWPGQPAVDADPDRARHGLAGPGARRRAAGGLDAGPRPGSSSLSTTRPSRRSGWPARRAPRGGTAPAVYNAANEVCVDAFLDGRLRVHRDRGDDRARRARPTTYPRRRS